jgi:tetrapyrrole methylase family protein/MazG family protein
VGMIHGSSRISGKVERADMEQQGSSLPRLASLMARLRGPEGCPWDRKQTLQNLKVYLIDEAYEVLQAIDAGDPQLLCEELGDLLFQIVFIARLAQEDGSFDLEKVIQGIHEKMIRRHPHVFGHATASTPQEVLSQWDAIKKTEGKPAPTSALSGVPDGLPALYRAYRLGLKAAKVGFDWPGPREVMHKVREELGELERALEKQQTDRASQELGDLLFALANLARHLGREPEGVLRQANQKFQRRFEMMEQALKARGISPREAGLEQMEQLWEEVKAVEQEP